MNQQSLENWHSYFEQNSAMRFELPWHLADELSPQEKTVIAKSIATFQLGEHSEGRHLLNFAEDYAQASDNKYIVPITRYFIAEEQNHALLLKKFMVSHDIPLIKKNWADSVFRELRKHIGLEVSITVLITAEMLSLIFYDALKQATGSSLLEAICGKLLRDEVAHIKYESELLEFLRSRKSWLGRSITRFLHSFLFAGTTLVVYVEHRKVINAGGYQLKRFWLACWEVFDRHFSPRKGTDTTEVAGRVTTQKFLP